MTTNQVVIIMLDGFRWDYWERDLEAMKGFQLIRKVGVQAEALVPVFPVLSYPNWISCGTGVHVDKHGIIGNYMIDLSRGSSQTDGKIFNLRDKETQKKLHWWEGSAEPIWTTATKQGKRVFTRLWSRSDIPFDGVLPEEFLGYEDAPGVESIEETLEIGVKKLLEGFDFVMLYGEHIDNVGHACGPDSEELRTAVREVDAAVCSFLKKLEDLDLARKVNVIIMSDHGMTGTGRDSGTTYINLSDYISEDDVEAVIESGTNLTIATAAGKLEEVYAKLQKMEGVEVYKTEQIPSELRFKSRHLLDIYMLAKPGYMVRGLDSKDKQIPYREFNPEKPFCEGVHGYLPNLSDQKGIFVACGPAFKENAVIPEISMVDIYQVLAKILGVNPQPHDGDWAKVAPLFAHDN